MEQQPDVLINDLTVNNASQQNLIISAKWGKFLSIIGFISCGLMVIIGLFLTKYISATSSVYYSRMGAGIMPFGYVLMAAIFFFPSLYLYKYSTKMSDAIRNQKQDSFDDSIMNLKHMFKFYGILAIILICFYTLIFMGLIFLSGFSRA